MEDEDLIQEQQQSSAYGPLNENVQRVPEQQPQQPVSEYQRLQQELERLNKSTRSYQALQASYAMFQEEGYSGGFDSYFELLCNNPEALDTAFQMFQEEGFSGDIEDFRKLVGVEAVQKKNTGETGQSESEGTTIDSPSDPELKTKLSVENEKALNAGTFKTIKDLYENRPTKEEYYTDGVIPEITQLEEMPTKEDGGTFLQKLIDATNFIVDNDSDSFVTMKDRGISKAEMEYRKKKQEEFEAYKKGEKELDYITNLANNLTNQMGYLAGVDDRHKFAYAAMYRDLDALQASALEIERLDSYADPVYTPEDFFKDDEKSIGKFGMAVTTGLSGFLGSAVIGGLTAGYGLFTDFASSQIYRYNKREADAKGIGLEEHLVSGDADILTPATIGVVQGLIEKMQLGSIARGINKIPNSALRATIDFFKGLTVNGAEEWGQESLDILSEHIADADAKGEVDPLQFGESVAKEMFSWRTGNAFLLGAFGSGAARLSGGAARRAFDLLKTDEQKQQDLENVRKLADIERIRSTKKKLTPDEKAALKIAEKRAKDALAENQKLVSDKVLQMTDDELEQMNRLYHEDKDLNSRIAGIEQSTTFSEEEKRTYIDELLEEKKKVSDRIKTVEEAVIARDPQEAQVVAAPFFDFEVANTSEAGKIRGSKAYLDNLTNLTQLATDMGIRVEVVDKTIGGYEHERRGAIQEVSTVFNVISTDMDKIAEFAAIAGTKTAAVQDATIAARYTEEGGDTHNADEWTLKVDNIDATLEALKEAGITEFTLNEDQGTVSFLDIHEFRNEKLDGNMNKLIDILNSKGVNYEGKTKEAVESRYIDRKERKRILQSILQRLTDEGKTGTGLYTQVREALINHERFLERRFPEESSIRSYSDKKKYNFTQTDNADELAALKDRTLDPRKKDLIEQAEKAAKAFQAVAPDAVIRLHETKQSYAASVGGKGGRTSMGAYSPSTNIIHISLKDADPSTVGHEVFHMLLRRRFTSDEQIQAVTKELFDILKEQVGGKTKEAIERLVANYAENKQDEERIVELFGLMSSNQIDIPKTSVQAIKQWVNKVAKILGIGDLFKGRDVGRAEVIDIFKRLSTKVADGSQITDVDIHAISEANDQTEVNSEDLVRPKLIDDDETLTKRTVGPFDVQYFNETERFQQLIDEGRLITHVDASFLPQDAEVVVHSPDNMFVGDIYHKGEKIIKGEGGLFYTLNTDNVWASTEKNLSSLVNTINKAVKASKDGTAYMILVGGSNSKMLGSISASSAALEVLNKMPDKGIFSRGNLRAIIAQVGKEQGIDIPPKFGVEKMISHINNTFLATEKPSFDDRRNFIQSIVSKIGQLDGVKNNKMANQKFREFFGMSDRSKISKAGFTNNLANLLTEPLLQGLPSGHAYAAIEINGPVEGFKENSHRSYAGAVRQKEGKPVLHLFDRRQNINDIVNTQEGLSVSDYKDASTFRGVLGLAQAGLGIGRTKKVSIEEEVMAKLTPEEQSRADKSDRGWKNVTEEGKALLSPRRRTFWKWAKDTRDKFMMDWMDRQYTAKRKLLKIGSKQAKRVYNNLITAAGASASAKAIFRKYEKLIYGGLNNTSKELLDRIIAERRLIAIDENITKRNKNLKNAKKLTKEYKRGKEKLTADDSRAALKRLREQLGEEKYNDLNNRADIYFGAMRDSLKRLYEAGRITEKMYLDLRDIEYSPIRTIKFMLLENQDLYSQDSIDAQAEKYGMTVDDIKTLTEANEDAYVQDSRWLLRTQIAVTEKKYFTNTLLSKLGDLVNEDALASIELGIGTYIPGLPNDPLSRKAFLSKKGLAEVKYKDKGEDASIFMPIDLARQILDIDPNPEITAGFRKFGKITGTNLLRFQATGGNTTFFVRNVPMDFLNVLAFTDAYTRFKFPTRLGDIDFKLLSGIELAKDAIINATRATLKTNTFKQDYQEFLKYGGGLDFLGVDGISKIEQAKIVRGLKNAKEKAGYYFVKSLSHFNEIAELTFRLSVYNRVKADLIKEYKKANDGGTPKNEDLDTILFEAAAKARASIDFAQGGVKARRLDKALPYFNPAMQSTRRVLDLFAEKPVEAISNLGQISLMAGGVVAGMGMVFSYLMGTDDEDEVKEKIRQFREGLSEYEKSNYFTYPTGINEDGTVKYVRIRKLPILSIPVTLAEEYAYKNLWGVEMDDKAIAESVLSSAPVLPTNLLSRNPAISAAFALGNWDTFRREKIFVNPDPYNPIPPSKEGIHSEYVNEIYKVIGDKTGFSPMRTQRAAEKLFTNPNTNPIVGLAYAGFEVGLTKNSELNERMGKAMDEFKEATSKAMIRNTNPDLQKYKVRARLNEEIMEIMGDEYERDQKYKRMVRDVLKNDPSAVILPDEFRKQLRDEFGQEDYIRVRDKYTRYLTLKNGDSRMVDIVYQRVPEIAAKLIMSGYGAMDPEVFEDFNQKVKALTGKGLSKRTRVAYGQLMKEAAK